MTGCSLVTRTVALHYAASSGDVRVVRLLLAQPAVDVNERDRELDSTPLHRAAENGHVGVTRLLLADRRVIPMSVDVVSCCAHMAC
jgi:ankyrin repeat protein